MDHADSAEGTDPSCRRLEERTIGFVVVVPEDAREQERIFLEALQRIMDGSPVSDRVKAIWAKGRTPVTQRLVAQEASRSRTDISGDRAKWPRVRDEITRAIAFQRAAGRAEDPERTAARDRSRADSTTIAKLRSDNRLLKSQRDAAYAQVGAMQLLLEAAGRLATLSRRTSEEMTEMRRAAENGVAAFTRAIPADGDRAPAPAAPA